MTKREYGKIKGRICSQFQVQVSEAFKTCREKLEAIELVIAELTGEPIQPITIPSIHMATGGVEAIAMQALPPGTPVILTNGPLEGARGTVQGSPKPLYLTIAVDAIRQSVRIQVPADWAMRTAETASGV